MSLLRALIRSKLTGGSGGGAAVLIDKTITENGTYRAADDSADGYKTVTADVPIPTLAALTATENGTYNAPTGTAYNVVTVAIPQKETVEWHQCPAAVRSYLAAAAAAYPADENVTVIDQFAPSRGHEVVADTKPVGYTIDGVTFRNNVPLVATPFATEHKAGTLTALDALRWINTTPTTSAAGSVYPRGVNCRDLGGWSCDGGTVRYGLLVRGGEPNPADRELMVDRIGVKTEVQLLPVSEQATDYKMKSPWGIDWAGNDTNETFYGLDKPYLWQKVLTAIMDSVLHSKPVYFHCGIGADRTGVVAMCLEAILGVSRADVDMDFELTNFYMGWQSLSGGIYRSRVYSTYKSLMTAVNAVPLANGLTDSFRNRWVSFALSCGISIDKINAFRSACIDGTPDVITVIIPTYSVTKNGNNVTFDNQIAEVEENQPYSVGITANSGYAIDSVTITMGGADVSRYYSDGTITIPNVTGNIVINVMASAVVRENLFDPANARYNKRIGTSDGGERVLNGGLITNMIDITNINTLTVEGITEVNLYQQSTPNFAIESYYSADTFGQGFIGFRGHSSETYVFDVASYKAEHHTATHIALYFGISTEAISAADVAGLAIYGE